ncbi:MAG TPA: hypothetical protein DCQ94_10955 [Nitrospira sp.]|nr:hypothetical protein [Nitrospira sp.]
MSDSIFASMRKRPVLCVRRFARVSGNDRDAAAGLRHGLSDAIESGHALFPSGTHNVLQVHAGPSHQLHRRPAICVYRRAYGSTN